MDRPPHPPDAPVTAETIPLREEVLDVGKRVVQGATVRIRTQVESEERTVAEELATTGVDIVRVPVGRVVGEVPGIRREGDALILPILEEELVVTRRLVLKEEVRITPRVDRRIEEITAVVRSERAVVTRHHERTDTEHPDTPTPDPGITDRSET